MKGIEMINASAGSGKTYSLTARVIEKLQGEVAPEGLMATTFTNKAAAELRERIRLELLKHDKPNEAQRIFDGFVGTVNSICARLLSEYALDAGLSPALDVLPEEDGTRLFKIAIAGVIYQHADAIEPAAKRLGRDGGGAGFQKRPDWREDVQRIVNLARANHLDGDALRDCAEKSWSSISDLFGTPSADDMSNKLEMMADNAIETLEKIQKPKQNTQKSLDTLKDFKRSRGHGDDIPWVEWVRISKLKTNKDAEGLLDDINQLAGNVLEHPGFQKDIQRMIEGVFKCAAEALLSYETFKQKQGLMDFVDQETMVLDLARNNSAFRDSMRDRIQQMMVDEFQDTSPIQLALFIQLNELAGQSVWVGDPKQAIYGFRGTDPQLMDEVIKRISGTKTLSKSWRSRETLVQLCNAVFSEVFHETGRDKVCLDIPAERKEKAMGGWIESWNLPVKNIDDESLAIANGVKDLLHRENISPGDIAILCRKNDQCENIASRLEALGIRASTAQGMLLDTRECQLAMAALRYMHDRRDTVALAEIVCLSPMHADHSQWLSSLVQEKGDAMEQWMKDPLIVKLDQARNDLKHWTPLEALEYAISKVDLVRTLKSWPNVTMRMNNLDVMRGVCIEYLDQCRARRGAATVAGFITYIQDAEPGQAQGSGEQTVQVLTYHRSKGLEWPIVILASLDGSSNAGAFGSDVVAAPVFDLSDPLANRSIRFWPWPFGAQKSLPELDSKLAVRDEEIHAKEKAGKESHRLMYVGMTRARDGLIFAIRKNETKTRTNLKTAWLDELTDSSGSPVLELPLQNGKHTLKVGGDSVAITVREYLAEEGGDGKLVSEPVNYLSPITDNIPEYPPARISPSGLTMKEDELSKVKVQLAADLGERIVIQGKPDSTSLGNALHGFLGLDHPGQNFAMMNDTASAILKRWGVENSITPDDMITTRERLDEFIQKKYSDAKVLREWPVTLRNAENQLMHGWIDMLLELPDGYVIIDHKSYPGADAEEYVKQFAPQLAVYKEAVEKATGKDVVATLVHMPVVGQVFELFYL